MNKFTKIVNQFGKTGIHEVITDVIGGKLSRQDIVNVKGCGVAVYQEILDMAGYKEVTTLVPKTAEDKAAEVAAQAVVDATAPPKGKPGRKPKVKTAVVVAA